MTNTFARLTAALSDRYRVERELGQGGMATVYLAHDLRHDRDVAIKVLHPDLGAALGGERFLSEIRTTARLQHPHILPLLDSGEADGLLYYVMPLVTGETLRTRLERERQLPIDDAIRIAREVADALDHAHHLGVIHRDIKPENILLQGGHALVADFGIALAVQSAGGQRMTQTGLSLGTPQYMSPEQAMGERVIDARSDIYALGAVTYEMLVGEAPFTGPSVQAIVAKVMTERPTAIHTLRDTVPAAIENAVFRALAKLPADRFGSARLYADALVGTASASIPTNTTTSLPAQAVSHRMFAAGLAGAALLGVAATAVVLSTRRSDVPEQRVVRLALSFPPGQEPLSPGGTRFAWSPDGDTYVYPGPGAGLWRLMARQLDELDAVPIEGSDGATSPTFSPDGQEIAFISLAPFSLKVVSVGGGQPRTLATAGVSGGGLAWARDGFLYVDGGIGLARIRPDGSDYEVVMPLDTVKGETGVAWVTMLPEDRGAIFRVRAAGESMDDWRIVVFDLRDRSRKDLVRGVFARYSPTGHLIWVTADGTLHAQRFDPDRLALIGAPATLWGGVGLWTFGASDLALSPSGDLLYSPGAARIAFADLVWVTRDGVRSPVDSTMVDGLIGDMALSPEGSAVALELLRPSDASGLSRIWVKRLGGGPTQLVTTESVSSIKPVWSRDGRDLFYLSSVGTAVMRRPADGSGTASRVGTLGQEANDFTLHPDQETVVFRAEATGGQRRYLSQFRLGADSSTPLPFALTGQSSPRFSPDGMWLAYVSAETGREEVYVRPWPGTDARKVQVSVDGGVQPRWHPGGGELFFLGAANRMMSARVTTGVSLRVTGVDYLFTPVGFQGTPDGLLYEPSPDGQRFLMLSIGATGSAGGEQAVLVQGFGTELSRRLPPD